MKYLIPLKAFEFVTDTNLEEKIESENKGENGFLVERDRVYPVEFHEKHLDFPVNSERKQLSHWSIEKSNTNEENFQNFSH